MNAHNLALLVAALAVLVTVFLSVRDLRRAGFLVATDLPESSIPGWVPAVALVATVSVWIVCGWLDSRGAGR